MADINATLTDTANVQATVSNTPVINVTMLGSGPPGPVGPAGGSTVTYEAGENMSSGRVVVVDDLAAWYFQNTDAAHIGRAFGITTTSATAGNNVTIQVSGIVSDAAFGFTADKTLWVGADGEIFDTQPGTGTVIQKAGVAYEDKKLLIDFSVSVKKN